MPRPLVGVLLCLCTIVECTCSFDTEEHGAVKRELAPDVTTIDDRGETVRLSDYKGKVVLLNFWATYCSPCRIEMPWFEKFQEMYGKHALVILGAAMDDGG